MSQENVEIVRRAYEALERDGLEALLDFFDPEIRWEVRPDLPDADTYQGHDGIRQLLGSFDEVLDESWYSPQEFLDSGDQVLVVLRWGGRGRGSGVAVEEREETWIFTLRDGKVLRVKEYVSKNEALEAAGLAD